VGSGWRFTSGISYYTCHLSGALAEHVSVSAILMRRLLPRLLYPGRARVGRPLARLKYDERVRVFDGVDWFWLPSILLAIRRLRREKPDVVVFQWWTGTVVHSYRVLAAVARSVGARIVIEFHEVQDTGELRVPLAKAYTDKALGGLLRQAAGFIVHSRHDRDALAAAYDLSGRPVTVVGHGPFDHHRAPGVPGADGVCRLLFFGTIRPYKGLEHLITAFNQLGADFHLTVVGETWEGWTAPLELIAASPNRDRITLVNRYVSDDEITGHFARADVVVLPYLRSSASGPLHIAMSNGLPVVVTSVGGLTEAVADYPGAVTVPPADVPALTVALRTARTLAGQHFDDPHSWRPNVDAILAAMPTREPA
jgi:glycosyltransferase involved in cell wall biosynthesis